MKLSMTPKNKKDINLYEMNWQENHNITETGLVRSPEFRGFISINFSLIYFFYL